MVTYDLRNCATMTTAQKEQDLIDCLNIAASLSAQLGFRVDDKFDDLFEILELEQE